MTRFKTISFFPSDMTIVDVDADLCASKDFGDYVVDDSHFVPMSEAVKRVTGGTLSEAEIKTMYDFPNGKDTGEKVPIDRTHRMMNGDIAEMSVEYKRAQKAAKESIDKAKEDFDFEQKLNAINNVDTADSTSQGE